MREIDTAAVTRFLLDVNVLIALVDPAHVRHDAAHAWFARVGRRAFATFPITENGLVRIVGHPKYPSSPGPPSAVVRLLAAIRALPGHEFWADNVSIAAEGAVDPALLSSHSRVTDGYLLALAASRSGKLATMDLKLATEVVSIRHGSLELL